MAQNKNFIKKKKNLPQTDQLIEGIKKQDIVSLSHAITLCESHKPEDRSQANLILNACIAEPSDSVRIGITGVPGVGKSTFIESFGLYLIEKHQKKVAVLAIDPSSEKSKGSILGDKTRMNLLSLHPQAFIRPSPSAGFMGGVAQHTRESIILCEAAGFDVIIIETVGVGQSETEVRQMADFFLLLMLAGAGDELQGIKRGIMEMADGIIINKADGDNLKKANLARQEYQNALHLFPQSENLWSPKVETCSALENRNMEGAWKMIAAYLQHNKQNGFFEKQRKSQLLNWFHSTVSELIKLELQKNTSAKQQEKSLIESIIQKEISPMDAASQLVQDLFPQKNTR